MEGVGHIYLREGFYGRRFPEGVTTPDRFQDQLDGVIGRIARAEAGASLLEFSPEGLHIEAGKILEESRSRANDILIKANEEANKILSSELPIDEAKIECEQIINKAREEADKKIKESKGKASEIRADAEKKLENIIGV